MMPNKNPITWPPIIRATSTSWLISLRDIFITVTAWLTLAYVLHDFWHFLYDYLSDPIFQLTPEQTPDWMEIWRRLSSFVYISGGLVLWITCIAIARKKILTSNQYVHKLPSYEQINRLEVSYGLSPTETVHWRTLRSSLVYVDEDGKIASIKNNEIH